MLSAKNLQAYKLILPVTGNAIFVVHIYKLSFIDVMKTCVYLQGDPLWSARIIKTNPEAISAVHTRYALRCMSCR